MQGAHLKTFQQTVWAYYHEHGRHDLPWRSPEADGSFDPYKIIVSEIMLQQTQVVRVLSKFQEFIALYPSFTILASGPLGDVLKTWSGLGYNRRAKFLWQAAQIIAKDYNGAPPDTATGLVQLPGIGVNTAGAILAYAFNRPSVFIETNIRTVFIYHFFNGQQAVHDREIGEIVAATLPDDIRQWYWALMDYGTHLKQTVGNVSRSSAQYTRQSAFAGSKRQIRGGILKILGQGPRTAHQLAQHIPDERLPQVLDELAREGLVVQHAQRYSL